MQNNYQQNLETLLDLVIQNGASDLHLGEGRHPFIRINGELTPIVQHPQLSKDDIVGMLGLMITPESLRKISNLQEVDFRTTLQERFVFVEMYILNLERWL